MVMVVARLTLTTDLISRQFGTVPGLPSTLQRLIIPGIPAAIRGGVSTDAGTTGEAGTIAGTAAGAVIGMVTGAGTGADSGPVTGMGAAWRLLSR